MSADNYMVIFKDPDGKYRGYICSASIEYQNYEEMREGKPDFEVNTIEEAIQKAQEEYTEYGYEFINLKLEER